MNNHQSEASETSSASSQLPHWAGLSPERAARVRLSVAVEPCDRVVAPQLVGLDGVSAWNAVAQGLRGPFARCRSRVEQVDLMRLWSVARATRMRVVIPGDDEWPPGLDDLPVPPWCLWVRGEGRLEELTRRSVAIVGSRAATAYGSGVARSMAADLGDAGFVVVSGAATGIDIAAHQGALGAGRPTVAALACGLDRAYPAAHRDQLDRIRDDGVLVSEYPPGQTPMKYRFLARNRLIAAMTAATVVVEAGLRSGSLNTAGHAVDLARPVAAVPGPVTSATSIGCHELIRQGAVLVSDASDVLELLGPLSVPALDPKREQDTMLDLLSEVAGRTRDAFPTGRSVSVDVLVARAGLEVGEVLAGLGELRALGMVEQRDEGWCLTRAGQ